MGKRSKERSEEEIRRKIRKLQNRLNYFNDMPQEQQSDSRSPQERDEVVSVDDDDLECDYTDFDTPQHETGEYSPQNSPRPRAPPSPHPPPPSRPPAPTSPPPAPTTPAPPPAPTSPPPAPEATPMAPLPAVASTSTAVEEPQDVELELEDDILELLGDAPKTETPLGPPIHKDVASRWQEILAKGLPKDIKDSLIKTYNVPNNCDLLIAPVLNPEVKAALPEPLVKRDSSLFHKQKQLGVALSALASAMDLIVSNETSKQKILKPISDACRILCDSHSSETKTRRSFVISAINSKLKDTLLETKRNSMLFGDNVTEKVKAAKTIQQSGDALKTQKPKTPTIPTIRPNNNANKKKNLNFIGQHRKVDNKPQGGTKRLSWVPQRPTANPGSSSRQRRSSPPRTSPQRAPAHPRR